LFSWENNNYFTALGLFVLSCIHCALTPRWCDKLIRVDRANGGGGGGGNMDL